MARTVDGFAHFGDMRGGGGGGFVVYHAHGFDAVLLVFIQARFNRGGIHTVTPIADDELRYQA